MKNKKWFVIGGVIIGLVIISVFLVIKINKKQEVKDLHIKLEKEWNLTYGEEITPEMYEDEELKFTEDDGEHGFNSIDKNNDGYILVGTNEKIKASSSAKQGIIEYYDLNGKIKWTKNYPNIDSNNWKVTSAFNDVLAVNDGYIVVGYEIGEEPETENDYNNSFIIKYDLNGNLIWIKKYNRIVSTSNLNNNLSYDFIDVLSFNEKYYIIGNLTEYEDKEKSENINDSKQYGFVIELDLNGNEISLNKYDEGSNFITAKVVDNKIIINSILGYEFINTDESFYWTYDGFELVSFDGNKFDQIIKYFENNENEISFEDYKDFVVLDGVYYFISPQTSGDIIAIDKDGNKKFSTIPKEGDPLLGYWFQKITTDGKNIYVYAYYQEVTSPSLTDAAIIIFDKEGNYNIVNIGSQYFSQIVFKDNSLLLPGSENSFAKYKINRENTEK